MDTTLLVNSTFNPTPLPAGYTERLSLDETLLPVCAWARQANVTLIIGVNVGAGPRGDVPGGPWRPEQAEMLVSFVKDNGCPVAAFEFGNEPNYMPFVFKTFISPKQLAADVTVFSSLVRASLPGVQVFAADALFLNAVGEFSDFTPSFLARVPKGVISGVTWHLYLLLSDKFNVTVPGNWDPFLATPERVVDPLVLDAIGDFSRKLSRYAGGLPVILGETASALGGGQENCSDVWADTLYTADLAGQTSKTQDLLLRQTFRGYRYGLIAFDGHPRPSYFFYLVFRTLCGPAVFGVSSTPPAPPFIRTYAFSGLGGASAKVLLVINLSQKERATLTLGDKVSGRALVMEPQDGTLTARTATINGIPLVLGQGGELPDWNSPTAFQGKLEVGPMTITFVLL